MSTVHASGNDAQLVNIAMLLLAELDVRELMDTVPHAAVPHAAVPHAAVPHASVSYGVPWVSHSPSPHASHQLLQVQCLTLLQLALIGVHGDAPAAT